MSSFILLKFIPTEGGDWNPYYQKKFVLKTRI